MNILTFDIEEWFHLLDNASTRTEKEWNSFESRIHLNIERILQQLECHKAKATFFCVGWIAEKYPEVIQQILSHGHEIGSHTRMHQLVYTQDPIEFRQDVEHSIKTLQDISGKEIKYFRAPGFSITERNKWAFEILYNLGIEIDSSVFPAARAHGGFPSYKEAKPSFIQYNDIQLKEMPISSITMFKKSIIFSGGGYFRLFPYSLVKKWTTASPYMMTYLHPRDFDPDQPVIDDLSAIRKFKSYVGIKGAEKKLNRWLEDFKFIDIQTADNMIDWEQVPVVNLN
ncbi:polysaccharide deacetylase family protein [Salinimicrobium sp. HB62]|uniref:polysaccharide deacetylase family protein n=1 Tax=Salinimicrobium sp. HB62 TaxID=3077781 RepID=UPI002D76D59D|nr:polysaccharide deacetylase family protein [Salinimicrobium sp. HB62]